MNSKSGAHLKLFLCGDVMTGRGIDQILPHPGNPVLHESYVRDARRYVDLAESAHGPISRPVALDYIWGDALGEWNDEKPDARIINLETSITTSGAFWPGKAIHYRMHPANIGCLTAADVDCCILANNHVLDWGYEGLAETLRSLEAAGLPYAGAGENAASAAAPVVIDADGGDRVLVFSYGSGTSGIPSDWGAAKDRPGVNLLPDLSEETARRIAVEMRKVARPDDVLVASIHWGSNWGYEIPEAQERFARVLVEEGVAIVHGHSSHHVRPIEVHGDRLILYGCGDFLTDYEGIRGYERFRGDIALMIFAEIDPHRAGRLMQVKLVPMQVRRFRLNRASVEDARSLCELLCHLGSSRGTCARLDDVGDIVLGW